MSNKRKMLLAGFAVLFVCFLYQYYVFHSAFTEREMPSTEENVIWAIEPQYETAYDFSCGAADTYAGDRTAFIDKSGRALYFAMGRDIHLRYSAFGMPLNSRLEPYFRTFRYGTAVMQDEQGEEYRLTRSWQCSEEKLPDTTVVRGANWDILRETPCLKPAENIGHEGESLRAGCLNRQGLWYIQPRYYASAGGEAVFLTDSEQRTLLVFPDGQIRTTEEAYGIVSEGILLQGNRYRFLDSGMEFPFRYEKSQTFSEGLAAVCKNGKWGYIDTTGALMIDPQYQEANPFSEGYAIVKNMQGKTAVIDRAGEVQCPWETTGQVSDTVRGGVYVCSDGSNERNYGLRRVNGTWAVYPKYSFHDIVAENGYYRLAVGQRYRIYLPATDELLDGKFVELRNATENILTAHTNSGYHIIHLQTGEISPAVLNLGLYGEGLFSAGTLYGDKIGFVDANGEWVIAPQFEEALPFSEGVAAVKVDGKWGYIANPLIYDTWDSDEITRGALLGLYEVKTEERPAIDSDVVEALSGCVEKITGNSDWTYPATGEALTMGSFASYLADAARTCGFRTACLLTYLDDVDGQYTQESENIAFTVCMGILSAESPTTFNTDRPISLTEAKAAILRLYEVLLDVETRN